MAGEAEDGDVRLVGGNETAGRVEIYVDGVWGTVCDDEWDLTDAHVVCRQLDFPGAVAAPRYSAFGPGVDPTLLYDLGCRGNEANLLECRYASFKDCTHHKHAGVVCLSHDSSEGGKSVKHLSS